MTPPGPPCAGRPAVAAGSGVAVFDLDHTLTRRDTFLAWLLGFLVRHPERWPRSLPLPAAVLWHKAGRRDNHWLKRTFLKAIVGGCAREPLDAWSGRFVDRLLAQGLWPRGIEAIERHRRAGDRLVLASASPDFYVGRVAAELGFDLFVCTRLSLDETGRPTGDLEGDNCYGDAKIERVLTGLTGLGGRLPDTRLSVYTDHHSDLGLLRLATHPVAVNPTRILRRQARAAGMAIENWRSLAGCAGHGAPAASPATPGGRGPGRGPVPFVSSERG